jgi:hypothetical protein
MEGSSIWPVPGEAVYCPAANFNGCDLVGLQNTKSSFCVMHLLLAIQILMLFP